MDGVLSGKYNSWGKVGALCTGVEEEVQHGYILTQNNIDLILTML